MSSQFPIVILNRSSFFLSLVQAKLNMPTGHYYSHYSWRGRSNNLINSKCWIPQLGLVGSRSRKFLQGEINSKSRINSGTPHRTFPSKNTHKHTAHFLFFWKLTKPAGFWQNLQNSLQIYDYLSKIQRKTNAFRLIVSHNTEGPPLSDWQWRHRTLFFFVGSQNWVNLVLFIKPWLCESVGKADLLSDHTESSAGRQWSAAHLPSVS